MARGSNFLIKEADQRRGNRAADLRLGFRIYKKAGLIKMWLILLSTAIMFALVDSVLDSWCPLCRKGGHEFVY